MKTNYWKTRTRGSRISRRVLLRGTAVGLAGLSGAVLIGCSDDDTETTSTSTAPPTGSTASGTSPTAAPDTTINRGGTIRMGTRKFPPGLDPDLSGTGYHMQRVVFDALLGFNEAGEPGITDDALASSFEIVDETTMLLTLREGVKFHDDTILDAEAVRWNFDRTLGIDTGASVFKGNFTSVERVEAIDDLTVRFTLNTVDAALPAALGYNGAVMLSPTHYDGKSDADVQWDPVGTGRYRFKSLSQDANVKFEAFEDHFYKLADGKTAALLDELHYVSVPDAVVQVASLESGDLDVIEESPEDQLDLLDANDGFKGVALFGFAIRDFYINHALYPMDNVDFRRALMWAVDRESYNNIFFGGRNSPATSVYEPASWAHIDVDGFPGYDLEKAQMFMERSGVPVEDRKLLSTAAAGSQTEEWQFVAAAWDQLGVQTEFLESAEAGARSNVQQGEVGDIHASLSRFTHKADPALSASVLFTESARLNYCACPTLGMEELVVAASQTFDIEERKALYADAQRVHADLIPTLMPMVNLAFWVHGKKDVVGMGHMADGRGDYRNLGYAAM